MMMGQVLLWRETWLGQGHLTWHLSGSPGLPQGQSQEGQGSWMGPAVGVWAGLPAGLCPS